MAKHFGVSPRKKTGGLKLTRENYITVNPKSSFTQGAYHDKEYCEKHIEACKRNFGLNMNFFSHLSHEDFESKLEIFLSNHKGFYEINDLKAVSKVSGYYLMVLDEYCQAYIGTSSDIKSRIMRHWAKTKEFDRLIFGNVENSILSVDSFRALDTTRIFVMPSEDIYSLENTFVIDFPENEKYLLNRTAGGYLKDGLVEAIILGRFRKLV